MTGYPRSASYGSDRGGHERRHARRSAYGANVRVEREIAWGMDISPLGLAVEMVQPVEIGDVVQVALSAGSSDGALAEIGAPAQVVRVDRAGAGARVALRFLDSDLRR